MANSAECLPSQAKQTALHLPVISLRSGTHMMGMLYRWASSFRRLQHFYSFEVQYLGTECSDRRLAIREIRGVSSWNMHIPYAHHGSLYYRNFGLKTAVVISLKKKKNFENLPSPIALLSLDPSVKICKESPTGSVTLHPDISCRN